MVEVVRIGGGYDDLRDISKQPARASRDQRTWFSTCGSGNGGAMEGMMIWGKLHMLVEWIRSGGVMPASIKKAVWRQS